MKPIYDLQHMISKPINQSENRLTNLLFKPPVEKEYDTLNICLC